MFSVLSCLIEKFIGNQLLSYGQHLSLSFTAETRELLPRSVTVFLEGSGISVHASLYSDQELESESTHTPSKTFTLRYVCVCVWPCNLLYVSIGYIIVIVTVEFLVGNYDVNIRIYI